MEKAPMNYEENQALLDLVTDYETLREQGRDLYWEERVFSQVIEYYERENQLSRAIEVTNCAIKIHAYLPNFYLKKAQLLIDDHQEAQALKVLEEASTFAPSDPEIGLLRAQALSHMGLPDEALELLHLLKKEADRTFLADILVCEAAVYEQMEEYEYMYHSLKNALQENPRHEQALEQLWVCIEATRRYEESLVLHQDIIEADPYSYMAWYNLGHVHAYLGNYKEAIEAYEYAFLTNEKFEFAYRDCAEMCFEVKQFRKALQCYEDYLERFEPDSDLYFCMGQCYQQLENYSEARAFYKKALNLDAYNDEILFCIGACFAKAGNWKHAVNTFKKAIDLEDTREEYFAALAEAYLELGNFAAAETNFKKAVDLAPDQIEYWMQYTGFLIEFDRVEEALDVLHEAEDYSTGAELLYCRIACLFALGRRQEALYWLAEALVEDYDLHVALFEVLPTLRNDPDVLHVISSYLA